LRSGVPHPEFSAQAVALLSAQHWRGNVRELRNVLEQLLLRSDTGVMDESDVAQVLRESGLSEISPVPVPSGGGYGVGTPWVLRDAPQMDANSLLRPLAQQVQVLERRSVAAALQATQGNKVAAAKLLGLSRAKLYQRLS
jgi:DNA-binding NtrC family response regulator